MGWQVVRIRDRSPEDVAPLAVIAVQTHAHDGYPKYLPEDVGAFIVDGDALCGWVAEVDGEVLGHVALHPRSVPEVMDVALAATGLRAEQIALLARLLVAPSARGRGIGRALLERATAEATALGRRAVLDVVEEHRDAIALYERCGWTRAGEADWSLSGGRTFHEFVYVSPVGPGRLP